jgi:tetratricopeptide (TPR) repeat protein
MLALGLSATAQLNDHNNSYYRGLGAMDRGEYEDAILLFTKNLEDNFTKYRNEALACRAECYLLNHETDKAIEDFRTIDLKENLVRSYGLARSYAQKGDVGTSIDFLKEHLQSSTKRPRSEIRTNPDFQLLKKNELWIQLWKTDWYSQNELDIEEAKNLLRNGKLETTLEMLDILINDCENEGRLYAMRAEVYEQLGELKFSESDYRKALELEPGSTVLQIQFARCLADLGKVERTRKLIDGIDRNELTPEQIRMIGEIEYEIFNTDASIASLRTYLQYYAHDHRIWLLQANNYFENGEYGKSTEILESLLSEAYYNEQVYLLKGNIYYRQNKYAEALGEYAMALDLNPGDYKIYVNRGLLLQEMNEKDKACRDFTRAFRLGYRNAYKFMQECCN